MIVRRTGRSGLLVMLLSHSVFTLGSQAQADSNVTKAQQDTASHYRLEGPGLSPEKIILPCRYFFVERKEAAGEAEEAGEEVCNKEDISVRIEGRTAEGRLCRAWTEIFPLTDGGFMVRYKFHRPCSEVRLAVLLGGEHVEGSPVLASGEILPDTCDCPLSDLQTYLENAQCPRAPAQMEQDLSRWSHGVDMDLALQKTEETFRLAGSQCWCHYVVKDNEVHRKCYGQHVGFNMFWDNTLLWLARRAALPDLEILVNLGDWPLVKPKYSSIPMFSWCGSSSTLDMVFPTYDLTESSIECMGRQSLDVLAAMGRNRVPWHNKTQKLFWRGRDSRQERLDLVKLSKANPDHINASITAFFFFREEEARLGKSLYVGFFDFFNHKYQMNIDGTVAAYRLPYLLAGNGVVFKQESQYYEHFYSSLRPWVHYIPVRGDLGNLLERIQWAREHDEEARAISRAAQKFARQHLLPHSVLCYHAQLLSRWASLLVKPVEVREGMERVERHETWEDRRRRGGSCACEETNPSGKEKHIKDEL